ncbi:MAG: efflux RND transporter periplasmic adaptor subunit [Gammaproteobacteria bacterium]|nr:efflux RND transporter periplasmic adaptor subunit [Gammaproteobacteria bacterium]MBU1601392.1 efflux RND transporter periplasmic adaptor subunit [Gammaproteobacteria bacterium]MBU2433587.1 efflux RND transporter periplasmic adaptor subunit [Gammaproteobacteria bacterium]MBU2449876.1 efflux RND transporter periplasmic adaptor subunit [Gammaproteobacteria bacterium]
MNKNTRFGIIAIALAGLAGLGYYAYTANRAPAAEPVTSAGAPGKSGGGAAPASPPTAVEVARVAASDFADDVAAVGTLKSNESVVLRPETAGRVASIGFKDGAIVAKGTVLVVFDAAIQDAEVQQARANLALAKSSYERNVELVGKKFLSQQALDSSAATLKVQEAAVQLAEAKAAKMRIKAPFTGMVGLRNVSVGDYLKDGQDLINIEDVATLRVDFKLPENYLGRVRKGQVVEVQSDALPGERFTAVLDAIDPLVDENGRAISARARLDNAKGKLRPGMFVRVRLLFGERKGVLMVPEQAIVPGGQPAVFKVVDGKASQVKVRLGVRRAAQVEVVDGLAAGDVVVTAGQLKLREGAAVRPVGDGAPTTGQGTAAGK